MLDSSSSSPPSRTQISKVLLSTSVLESVDESLTSVELSVDASLDSDASLTEDTVETASVLDDSCVETVSSVTVDSVGPVDWVSSIIVVASDDSVLEP